MKLSNFLLTVVACAFVTLARAQFPVVGTWQGKLFPVHSLSSGIKYIPPIDTTINTLTLYNTDLSVFRVLNFPHPAPWMYWSQPLYITEGLFDTDPSTVEFALQMVSVWGTHIGVYVYREDGTQLFSQDPGHLTYGPNINVNQTAPVYADAGQTYMLVHQPLGEPPATIYALPGSLPCIDCYGSPNSGMITGGVTLTNPFSGMVLQPNPAQSEVLVTFNESGVRADAIVVLDASGREVMRNGSIGAKAMLQVSHLSNGTYVVLALHGQERLGSLPLVISR